MRLRERVSAAEWEVRVNLAACYRLVAKYGMTDLIYNHITARVPGPEHHILISGYGMLYEEVTASSLIKVDLAGNIIEKPLEQACRIQVQTEVVELTAEALCGAEITLDNEAATNPLEWPTLLRSLDRLDRSYRD